jgi:hypothetical protein
MWKIHKRITTINVTVRVAVQNVTLNFEFGSQRVQSDRPDQDAELNSIQPDVHNVLT